jgi:hypothetical protein
MKEASGKYSYHTWAVVIACLVIIIAMLVLSGWQLDIEIFKRPARGLVAMNPITALCFILCSVGRE